MRFSLRVKPDGCSSVNVLRYIRPRRNAFIFYLLCGQEQGGGDLFQIGIPSVSALRLERARFHSLSGVHFQAWYLPLA